MEIRLEPKKLGEVDSDALVIVGFEGTPARRLPGGRTRSKSCTIPASSQARPSRSRSCIARQALKAKRLVLAGGGKRDKFDAAELRKLTGAVVRALKSKGIHSITLALDEALALR